IAASHYHSMSKAWMCSDFLSVLDEKSQPDGADQLTGKAQYPSCHPEQANTPVWVFARRTFKNLQQIADF
ncbi:MAG: hypothetical protein IIW17_07940, partial [Clostridia bacterium]|nr:hypothetical protein [Clostridia bacterium]